MATRTADILGSNRAARVPPKWVKHYERLCEERDRLRARDISAAETPRVKLDDLTDAASDESERNLSLVTATATQDIIFEVLGAIRRIERGTYGICELTGKAIEADRLHAIPWARYSLEGQQEMERNGLSQRLALPLLVPMERVDSEKNYDKDEAEESSAH
jgi:RNA polymerase-binding transcription factor DksA